MEKAMVRYLVGDVERALEFYTGRLGFQVEARSGKAFAMLSRGELHLILSGPGSSGARPMPDGRQQAPGGWNRIVLYVEDLESTIARLEAAGTRFRNAIEVGPGGSQIQLEDPDGSAVELHQAPERSGTP